MINILHLLWIIPLVSTLTVLVVTCMTVSSYTEKRPAANTNAGRIQSESEKELEADIHAISLGYKPWCDFHCENQGEDGCEKCIRRWLKEKPKEET